MAILFLKEKFLPWFKKNSNNQFSYITMVLKRLRTSKMKFCKISFVLLVISLEGLVPFEGFPKNRIQRFLKFLEFQELEVIKKILITAKH